MLIDKPEWISHGDGVAPIFSVDVHPDGQRLATAGGDGTVVLWSVGNIFARLGSGKGAIAKRAKKKKKDQAAANGAAAQGEREEKENDPPANSVSSASNKSSDGVSVSSATTTKYANAGVERVATLVDHRGKPVNVARFSNSGRHVASGGDNHLVLIHELRPSVGASGNGFQFSSNASFGSQSHKNVENWALCSTLTGHSNNVVDLAWCLDDTMVASCSLDNTVRIWDAVRGTLITVLQEHTSFVKGVVWDPVGKYIASQSDDRSVVVRTVEGWETVSHVKEPFERAVWNTFSTRLDWCPDGSHITAVNAYNKPKNTAAVLMRGSWKRENDYVGHKGPVVAARFNPRLFRVKDDDGNKYVASCTALGAQDKMVTVWMSRKARPVMIAKTFFNQSVVDLCWSPDGLTLFAASIDGTVACFAFEEKELGERLSEREVHEIMEDSYGTARLDRTGVAEDPALMELEEEAEPAAAAPAAAAPQKKADGAKEKKNSGVAKRPAQKPTAGQASVLVQRETVRQSDGKRKIAPVPIGGTGPIQRVAAPSGAEQASMSSPPPTPKRPKKSKPSETSGSKPRPQASRSIDPEVLAAMAARSRPVVIPPACEETRPRLSVRISDARVCEVQNVEKDIVGVPRELRISSAVQCLEGTKAVWSDKHLGTTVRVAAGCDGYLALGLGGGVLQVYSRQGLRMWPPVSLGAPLSFLELRRVKREGEEALGGDLLLLAVTTEGKLWLWDLEKMKCRLRSDVAPVAVGEGSHKVKRVCLSRAGLPLVVLGSNRALVYDSKLEAWVRVADGSHLHSEFASGLSPSSGSGQGELGGLQAGAQQAMASAAGPAARTLNMVTASEQRRATGRHLEFMTSAAGCLGDSASQLDWCSKLAKFLAQEGDQGKLREVLDSLLMGDKRKLKKILAAIASVRSVQRLVSEYLDMCSHVPEALE